jgi:hypothetical protein
MSMNQETENFEQLRRLLAIKRHEQPPPGYFDDFSSQVIVRIKAGDRGEQADILERLFGEALWLQRIRAALEGKPILAGVAGVAMCGLLVAGVVYSSAGDVPAVAFVPGTDEAPTAQAGMALADHPLLAKPVEFAEPSSTSPITAVQTDALLLGDLAKLRAQPAGFSFPSGN